ncbi:kojibiose phosphorylase [Streptomyces longisporoflavus]|uniref:discoidin domain-containing protein n=1 Tax=Streptomyces longisporoflavus TaxID=28044 RepID=UPI00167EE79E|nr:discoidin domain-containing protein [Streptomyces longisporoflavus]GGV29422.1 kojibiose phosphorylase [Streptomyces longisporoflavus]
MRSLPRTARFIAPLLASVLAAAVPPTAAAGTATPRTEEPTTPAPSGDGWTLTSTRLDAKDTYHAFVGNGYLGQRVAPNGAGYTASDAKTGWPLFTPRYDGSFVSGLYAHNKRTTENRQVAAAIPTWSPLTVSTGGRQSETFTSATPASRISHYRQSLDLRRGLVRTELTWTAKDGRATDLVYDVLADRANPHVGAVRLRMTPHWNGDAKVTDRIDGRGARRVTPTAEGTRSRGRTMTVGFRTQGTKTEGTVASTLRPGHGVRTGNEQASAPARKLSAHRSVGVPVRAGQTYELTKYVGVDTALTSRSPERDAVAASRRAAGRGWDSLFSGHAAAWRKLWRSDIEVAGQGKRRDLQSWVRSAQYGLLSSTRAGSSNSISPTGLSSDNYAGLVFWDAETWMYPALLAAHPGLAKSVVDYRYRTRHAARANAKQLGHRGLFYPWTSAGKGDLKSECHSVDPPHCRTQNHLQSDVALAAWQYYLATKDTHWLRARGWPVIKGIAEFWADRATRNSDASYSVKDVAGPDEYSNGVDDGVFTNAGAATTLRTAGRVARILGKDAPKSWNTVADKLRIPYDEKKKVFRQYDGYKGSVIKQADTVLLMYPLEWPMSKQAAANTLDYYAARTDPDGPAMTDSVHAIDAAAIGEPGCSAYTYLERSIRPFVRGPFNLFSEARGDKAGATDPLSGSPAQNFTTGQGGFLQVFTNGLTGQRMREDSVHLDPMLPPQLAEGVRLNGQHWQGRTYDIAVGAHETTVRLTRGEPFEIETPQGKQIVSREAPAHIKTRRPDLEPTDNLARCRPGKASSEQPGQYADAALDGNTATAWVPDSARATLTADLGKVSRISGITPHWTDVKPEKHSVQTSLDGQHWNTASPDGDTARYIRVKFISKDAKKPAGIEELTAVR